MRNQKNFQIVFLFLSIATIFFSAVHVNAADNDNIRNTVQALDCDAAGQSVELQGSNEVVAGKAEIKEIEMKVVDLINDERERQDLPWLSWNDQLFQVARDHSEEMAMMNESRNSDGCTYGDRLREVGYNWNTASEVIVSGGATAQELFSILMKRRSRRAEILSASYFDVGIGHVVDERSDPALHYWTLNLGTQRSVSGDSHADPARTNGGDGIEPSIEQNTMSSKKSSLFLSYYILGRVMNMKNGKPLNGATVTLCNINKKALKKFKKANSHLFCFIVEDPGHYLLHVEKRGYFSTWMWANVSRKHQIESKTVVLTPR